MRMGWGKKDEAKTSWLVLEGSEWRTEMENRDGILSSFFPSPVFLFSPLTLLSLSLSSHHLLTHFTRTTFLSTPPPRSRLQHYEGRRTAAAKLSLIQSFPQGRSFQPTFFVSFLFLSLHLSDPILKAFPAKRLWRYSFQTFWSLPLTLLFECE